MEHIDCFAYENENKCNALIEKRCQGCKFYKEKTEYDNSIEKAIILCKEKGISTYDDYFKYYRKMKKIKNMKGADTNE